MLQKAIELLNNSNLVSLASINENGFPVVCVITRLQNEGLDKIYFATRTSSKKADNFKANPKASISYYNQDDGVTLIGKINIIETAEIKKSLWQDWLTNHFPGGVDDPEYCVLEFVPIQATIYIEGNFATVEVK